VTDVVPAGEPRHSPTRRSRRTGASPTAACRQGWALFTILPALRDRFHPAALACSRSGLVTASSPRLHSAPRPQRALHLTETTPQRSALRPCRALVPQDQGHEGVRLRDEAGCAAPVVQRRRTRQVLGSPPGACLGLLATERFAAPPRPLGPPALHRLIVCGCLTPPHASLSPHSPVASVLIVNVPRMRLVTSRAAVVHVAGRQRPSRPDAVLHVRRLRGCDAS
jgi:hypothetical protein